MTDRLVWIDCEMTGLDLARDALIEIACLVTDGDLAILDDGVDLVIKPPAEALDQMAEVVRQMHTASGLLAELATGVSLAEAQDRVLSYVRGHVAEPRKVPLCGNSIATDRSFLARDMPELDAYLHYRMVDVSSVKELARRWYPRAYSPARLSAAATGRWPTLPRASKSCGTTGPRCSSRHPARTRSRPATSPNVSPMAAARTPLISQQAWLPDPAGWSARRARSGRAPDAAMLQAARRRWWA